jgi:AICAR transformylase/IMP cyclohydrolase PurH (only IMP cyclohydrolase domain in Aful)
VGGPTRVRSAAKNYRDVTVITSPEQYEELILELKKFKGTTTLNFREKL